MRRIYFFLFINLFIIPITGRQLAEQITLSMSEEADPFSLPKALSQQFMNQQYFYIKFIIQLSFISNGFWLIDLVHRVHAYVCKKLHERREKDSIIKT